MAKPHHSYISVLATLLILPALSMTGCMSPQNDRSYVGTDPQLVAPLDDVPYQSDHQLDRTQWPPTTINIPVDNTAHRPTYNSNLRHTRITTRQRNEFPTAEQALELTGDSLGPRIAEVPVGLGSAIIDAAAMPVRLVTSHQGMTHESPNIAYQRTPPHQRTPQYQQATPAHEAESPLPAHPTASMTETKAPTTSEKAPLASVGNEPPIGTMTPVPTKSDAPANPDQQDEDQR